MESLSSLKKNPIKWTERNLASLLGMSLNIKDLHGEAIGTFMLSRNVNASKFTVYAAELAADGETQERVLRLALTNSPRISSWLICCTVSVGSEDGTGSDNVGHVGEGSAHASQDSRAPTVWPKSPLAVLSESNDGWNGACRTEAS